LTDEVQDSNVLERLVLRYLLDHPSAADSIEGVRLWWLREAGAVSQVELERVLNKLLERGWLVTRGDRPETRIYSLNEREREAVERFVLEPGERLDG
jgi:DNA-binding PadR family transcriptional regulator